MVNNNLKYRVGASLACANQLDLMKEINELIKAGIDFFHIDIMDGVYVNNYCFGLNIFNYLKEIDDIEIEVHLMVADPYNKVDFFKDKFLHKLSFHIETCDNPIQTLSKIKRYGKSCGIAVNAATPEHTIEYLYDFFDYILVMSVEAGFAGQNFIKSSVDKVFNIREQLNRRKVSKDIYVDGHIDTKTINLLSKAGANAFICGTAGLFKENTKYKANINKLKSNISNNLQKESI